MPKAGFISLGCPKNLVDSEVMMGILARSGYEFTPRAEDAEVLVVNTCSFIAPAQKESIDTILEMAEYKKFGAAKRLIVAGCLVERFREQILEQIPEVDAVVGTGEVERDRKSTRLNSSHLVISYAVFCLKKKNSETVTISAHSLR